MEAATGEHEVVARNAAIVFPEVELVHHIPWPDHPLGRYVRDKRHVELSRKELLHSNEDIRRYAVYHELGHWWRIERIPDSLVHDGDDEEAFADMFALFFLHSGDGMSREANEIFLCGMTMNEEVAIMDFAERVILVLNDELAHGDAA